MKRVEYIIALVGATLVKRVVISGTFPYLQATTSNRDSVKPAVMKDYAADKASKNLFISRKRKKGRKIQKSFNFIHFTRSLHINSEVGLSLSHPHLMLKYS
jgi:hypothetical protein